MPPNVAVAAFIFGSALLLIALLGGGFEILGVKILNNVGRNQRITAAVLGAFFIFVGLANPFDRTNATPAPTSVAPTQVAVQATIDSPLSNQVAESPQPTAAPKPTAAPQPSPTSTPAPTAIPTPEPPTVVPALFADNFDSEMSNAWRQTEGVWNVVNEQLTVLRSSTPRAIIEVGDDTWDNYSIDFDTGDYRGGPMGAILQSNKLVLFARVKDENNAAFFAFEPNSALCGSRIKGVDTPVPPSTADNTFAGAHHVHIEMKGATYKMSVDNHMRCSYQDNAFQKGGVHLQLEIGATGSWPYIDNFEVKHIP
jgi:hypothetical protein